MTIFLIALEKGLGLGSIYLLVGLSFTLVLAVSSVFNFVQGSLLMVATLLSFILGSEQGWPAIGVLAAIVAFGFLAGLLTHTITVRPVLGRTKDIVESTLLTTIGAGFVVNAVAALLFGSQPRPVRGYVSAVPWKLGNLPINKTYIVIIAVTLCITIGLDQFLRHSDTGRTARVTLEDSEGARLVGVDVRRVILVSFAIAGALAALAGWLVAPVILASAFNAQDVTFFAFAGMAIGGFGSFGGAMLGGLIVGLVVAIVPAYINPDWADPLVLVFAAVILILRPAGLLGTAGLFGATRQREL